MEPATSAHVDTFCRDHLPAADLWPDLDLEQAGLQYPPLLNCATELLDVAADDGGRRCLLSPTGVVWTYGDLLRHADQVAWTLVRDFGLVPGNRVLLRGPNNPWLLAAWFGVLKAGGVVVTTMPLLRAGELAAVCDIAHPGLAICDHRFVDDLAAAGVDGMAVLPYGSGAPGSLEDRAAGMPTAFPDVRTAADDVALLAFTSGTTGRPKATMHFHRDVLAIADTFSRHVLKPTRDDLFAGTPPIGFTFGLGGSVVFPLRAGASVLLVERAGPDEFADLVERFGVTVCFTAPTAYRALLASDGRLERLRTVRRAVSAGEHLPAFTWCAFRDATGIELIDGIGSTEMLHIFIASADDDIRPGATGRPVPGYEAKVVDAAGREVPDGTAGLLAVRGPTGCRYLDDIRQLEYVRHGWNLTGDVFTRDADGYFWYGGRNDDLIVSGGYNIAAVEVEEAVSTHPEVAECAVVASPDPMRGSVVKAFVVPRGGARSLAEPGAADRLRRSIQDTVKAAIAPYKYPREIDFVDRLPRTSTGKVQRYALRDLAATTAEGHATANIA